MEVSELDFGIEIRTIYRINFLCFQALETMKILLRTVLIDRVLDDFPFKLQEIDSLIR